jgi:hypothetical protein
VAAEVVLLVIEAFKRFAGIWARMIMGGLSFTWKIPLA